MPHEKILGNRRFSCLSNGLIRLEFSPDGKFEDRRTLAAAAERKPIAFTAIEETDGAVCLKTPLLTVVSRDHDKDFFPSNLEVRWNDRGLTQVWRPGDVDHRNLGGTVRCLDLFSREAQLSGVHPAGTWSNETHATHGWLGWDLNETDPQYYRMSGAEARLKNVHALGLHTALRMAPDDVLVRSYNNALDSYSFGAGLLSRSGYFLLDDSTGAVLDADGFPVERDTPGTKDWYLFAYGRDYRAALRDFVLMSGKSPLPSKNVFGLFFSRWPAYDEQEAKQIVEKFSSEGVPLSVLVIDMEWHKEGWCNWDWDNKMYPDPKAFFAWCHDRGLQVTLNVHPQRIRHDDSSFPEFVKAARLDSRIVDTEENEKKLKKVDTDLCRKEEAGHFMRICHDPIVEQGMDFWWLDGCSGTINGSCNQLVNNKVYFENSVRDSKRGMLLSRYGGIGSHRYGVFFTGDAFSHWEVLARQCEFNIRAGHLGLAYISHDIGGFVTDNAPLIDAALYVRWLQFGVFNPVMRFHSAPGSGSRQPWDYGEVNAKIARQWLRLRNSLVPYIYAMARQHHDTGTPIVRGIFFDHPADERAYRYDQFFFGDSFLVAPMLSPHRMRTVYLPAGEWVEYSNGKLFAGAAEHTLAPALGEVSLFVRAGTVIVRQSPDAPPFSVCTSALVLDVFPGTAAEAWLYEDDGRTEAYEQGESVRTEFSLEGNAKSFRVCGHAPEGTALCSERTVVIEACIDALPKSVSLNGNAVKSEAIAFDEKTKRCRISLGKLPAKVGFDLEIIG